MTNAICKMLFGDLDYYLSISYQLNYEVDCNINGTMNEFSLDIFGSYYALMLVKSSVIVPPTMLKSDQ